jgi:alpha-ketoglutarate-dependent taurine dioxygenase
MVQTKTLETIDLTPNIGSEFKVDKDALLSGAASAEIRALLVKRGVVIARDIELTDDEQRQLAKTLGDVRLGTFRKEGEDGLMAVTQDEKINPEYAKFFFGSLLWHMDGHYEEVPPFATVVRPKVLPPVSHTDFANTYAAYEGLSAEDKALVGGLKVIHTMQSALFPAKRDCTPEEFALWSSYPERAHPLVWHHKSGRKSLILSTSGSHIPGMHPVDSQELLQRLMAHATQPKFTYRHEWRMNDLLLWDNTGTMHRARPHDPAFKRVLARFTLNGEEPIRAAA